MSDIKQSTLQINDVVKIIISVFMIGAAWARIEYKMDKLNDTTRTLLEKYVISNDYEKKIINLRIDQMQAQLDVNTLAIKTLSEYLKPEEPIIKRKTN